MLELMEQICWLHNLQILMVRPILNKLLLIFILLIFLVMVIILELNKILNYNQKKMNTLQFMQEIEIQMQLSFISMLKTIILMIKILLFQYYQIKVTLVKYHHIINIVLMVFILKM